MKFFIPKVNDEEKRDETLNKLVRSIEKNSGGKVDSQRIFSLDFKHGREHHKAVVGKEFEDNGEIVIAILHESIRDTYFIFTPMRGYYGGMPIQVGKHDIVRKTLFDKN